MKPIWKKALTLAAAAVFLTLTMAGCSRKEEDHGEKPIVTFQLTPSSDGVDEFMELLGDFPSGYDSDQCFQVTPLDIVKRYGFQIFKFDTSCASFLRYEDKIYPLGEWFGGSGVTSFAAADLNEDGKPELYFTCSWGSGIHRSLAGYFDSKTEETVYFDFTNWENDSVLKLDENQTLCVYNADCDIKSFVDINMTPGDKLAKITWVLNKITFTEE